MTATVATEYVLMAAIYETFWVLSGVCFGL